MPKLQIVQGIETPVPSLATDVRDLQIVETDNGPIVISTTGINGGLVSYELTSGQSAQTFQTTSFLPDAGLNLTGEITTVTHDGTNILVIGHDETVSFGYELLTDGSFGALVELGGLGASGEVSAFHDSSEGTIFMADANGIGVFHQSETGAYSQTATLPEPENNNVTNIICTSGEKVVGGRIILAANSGEGRISSYCLDTTTGQTDRLDSIGVEDGFGLLPHISGFELVSTYGASFAVIASSAPEYGAGALSTLRIAPDGTLIPMDHVLDSLTTRFGQVQSLSTVTAGERSYIIAGGGDDGLSLFMLLPTGHLLYLDTLAHSQYAPLENLSAIAATQVEDEVQIFTASSTAAGLSQFSFSIADQGLTLMGTTANGELQGSGQDDLLNGGSGNELILGNDGHDTLIDGAGEDTLIGGGGYDLFVLDQDGVTDRIESFDKGNDEIDLSAYAMLYDPATLEIESTATGALIHWHGETTEVIRKGGGSLTRSDILNAIVIGPDRPPMTAGRNWTGTAQDDALSGEWGNDTLIGNGGRDHLTGGIGHDLLSGGAQNDTIIGGDGDDTILGGNGRDRVNMGTGNDIYTDTKQGKTAGRDYVEAGEGNDTLHGGGGNDRLFGDDGDDDISGEAGNDKLFGGVGDDKLSGQQGADRIFAGSGADTVIGGNGRDTAWLGAGDDLWRDSPQTGRIGSDKIIGGTGNDTLASKGGNDTLEGGAGADTFIFYGAEGSSQIIDFHPGEDTLRLVIDGAMRPEFVLTTGEEGLLLSWADGELSLIGLSEGDMTLSDILFDLG